MPVLQCKTKGNESSRGLPRVYFCCHPKDLDRFFTELSDELLQAQHCSVWYAGEDIPRDEEFWLDLEEMNLFFLPVTADLLYTDSTAMRLELPFAIRHNIPILPVMLEEGLVVDFNKNELLHNRQYLDKFDPDPTALPYREKLKNNLQVRLISDEQAQRIRKAFDARLFLSYRKKDRAHAQKLMELIHRQEAYRDVSIWYDEFLKSGEDFNAGIEQALNDSQLFVLTVTPNVLEYVPDEAGILQKNYVAREEFPRADTAGIPIVPVQMVTTDPEALAKMFEKQLQCADAHSGDALRLALEAGLDPEKLRRNDADPCHNYLIGLAYMTGLDLEKNVRLGVELIKSASDAGLIEATEKLVEIYHNGIGVAVDVNATIERTRLLISQRERAFNASPDVQTLNKWFWSVIHYVDIYLELEQYRAARSQLVSASAIARKAAEMDAQMLSLSLQAVIDERMGDAFNKESYYDEAAEQFRHCLSLRRQLLSLDPTVFNRQCLALALERLGDTCIHSTHYLEAIGYFEEKLKLDRLDCAKNGTEEELLSLFGSLYKLSRAYLDSSLRRQSDTAQSLSKAREYGSEAMSLADSFVSANDNPLARYRQSAICTLMGSVLLNDAEFRKATGAPEAEYQPIYDQVEPLQYKGLEIAQAMYITCGQNLQSTRCLISAYRALAERCRIKTSELFAIDYNLDMKPDRDILPQLEADRQLLETARAYYNKALDLAQGAHRIFGIHSTAQLLFHCRMDMASTLAHLSRLPHPPKIYRLLRKQVFGHYEDALKLAQQLARKIPSATHQEQVASVYTHMGAVGMKERKMYLPESIAIYKKLCKEYPNNPDFAHTLHSLEAMLAGKPGWFQIV